MRAEPRSTTPASHATTSCAFPSGFTTRTSYRVLPSARYGDGPVEYSHTLTGQIGGQLAAGFVLTHLTEAPHHADNTGRYMPGYFATRAIRP